MESNETPVLLCTIATAARALSVSTMTIRRLVNAGHLEGRRIGGRIRITMASLNRLASEGTK